MRESVDAAPAQSLRDRILASAWIEFGDKGFYGARMDEIAKSAGASKQVLYHHFASKDGLFRAVVEQAYISLRALDDELLQSLPRLNPDEALVGLIEGLFGTDQDSIRFQRLMHDENRFEAVHAVEMKEIRKLYARLVGLFRSVLERGADEGCFKPDIDPSELFASLAGLFMFPLINRYTLSTVLDLPLDSNEGARQSRLTAIRLVLDGLRP